MTILYITTLVFVLIREYFFNVERESWKQERQTLLDRIQARDLPEFVALTKPKVKKETEKEKEPDFL